VAERSTKADAGVWYDEVEDDEVRWFKLGREVEVGIGISPYASVVQATTSPLLNPLLSTIRSEELECPTPKEGRQGDAVKVNPNNLQNQLNPHPKPLYKLVHTKISFILTQLLGSCRSL